jgi:hypothetical protein
MKQAYEIPAGTAPLDIGNWVEIFEAYADDTGKNAIRVKRMRVQGRLLTFGRRIARTAGSRPLRPHEGQVVSVEKGSAGIRFNLRLTT